MSEFLRKALEHPASSHIAFFRSHVERRYAFGEDVDLLKDLGLKITVVYMDYSIRFPEGGRIFYASVPYRNELMKFAGIYPLTIDMSRYNDPGMEKCIEEFMAPRMERRSK